VQLCNCEASNLNIRIVACDDTHPCVPPDACTTSTCVDGTCETAPVTCVPTNNCFTAECVVPSGCVQTPLACDNPAECQECVTTPPPNPNVCGTCVPSLVGPPTCTYPNRPNGDPCDGADHECQDGMCVPTGECDTAQDCPCPAECLTVACVDGTCEYSAVPDGTTCGAEGVPPDSPVHNVCFHGECEQCLVADNCPGADACNIASCSPNTHTCDYTTPDCSIGGTECSINCCDPEIGCVHTPSDNACELDDPCNVGFCTETGCDSDPLIGRACGDPSTCNTGVCVLQSDNIAICQATNPCVAPDNCSSASCDSATGECTITSRCLCPEFCDNASGRCLQCDPTHPCPDDLVCDNGECRGCKTNSDCQQDDECIIGLCKENKCHYKLDPHCDQCRDNDDSHGRGHGGGGGFGGGFGPGLVSIPVPVVTPVATPLPVPPTTVVATPGIDPLENSPATNAPSNTLSGGVKDSGLSSGEKERGSSCASTATSAKDLWIWMIILGGVYSIRKKKRAQAITN